MRLIDLSTDARAALAALKEHFGPACLSQIINFRRAHPALNYEQSILLMFEAV